MAKVFSAFSVLSMASAISGEETHCIGPKAHLVKYDIVGDSLETLSDAAISLRPQPELNAQCSKVPSHGDKAICVGANVDETCSTSAADVKINSVLDCPKCFAGFTSDLFYTLNISAFKLKGVEIGLRENYLHGAAEIHAHGQGSGTIKSGSIDIIDSAQAVHINFKIANIVPVDITIGMPTVLDYKIGWDGALDAVVGADLDVNLGDHWMTWTEKDGFSTRNTSWAWATTPVLAWNSGNVDADIDLDVKSSVQIDVDKIMWYHFNTVPSFPTKVGFTHQAGQQDKVCVNGDADFLVTHEADVHFTLLGKTYPVFHYGPKELYHYHKDGALHKCLNVSVDMVV